MIGVIVLAAGNSTRMGASKQLLDVKGDKLLRRTVRTILKAEIDAVVVVLGAGERDHRRVLEDLDVSIVSNKHWATGMGSSIKRGLAHLRRNHSDLTAVIISVCDQPLLNADIISGLISGYRQHKKPVIASGYAEVPGVPVLFDRSFFDKLDALPDNQGAKKIILQNPADVHTIPFAGGEVDLDTMEDYNAFLAREYSE